MKTRELSKIMKETKMRYAEQMKALKIQSQNNIDSIKQRNEIDEQNRRESFDKANKREETLRKVKTLMNGLLLPLKNK